HRDGRALLQRRRIRRPEAGNELWREVDVDDAGDAEATEERSPSLRAPDEARAARRARLDLLGGPHLHLCSNARVLADDRVIADDASLLEDDVRLQRTLPADDRAVELGSLADIRVAPDDGAIDDRPDVDGDVIAEDGRPDDLGVRTDLHAFAEKDGARELRGFVDVDIAGGPDARHELVPEILAFHLSAKEI